MVGDEPAPLSSLNRFSSRNGRLSHVFLKDRLAGAKSYRRIAGYFRSSVFELVEEEIVRRIGLGAGAGLFAGLDRDALATIGIDLDAVRARIEASFGPQALTSAAQAAHQGRHGHPGPGRPGSYEKRTRSNAISP